MVNTEIRLIIFFAVEDRALYSQHKQDLELTVAHNMSFLLKRKKESEVIHSCPTLCDPMDCSLPGSSIHGIFQARVLEWRCSIQSAKTRLRTDCGSDHELLIVKFRLKLKKVGKNTRPLRNDPNQIPCNYTVAVTASRD